MVGVARTGQRSYDYQATGGQPSHSRTHQMAKPTLHLVAYDGSAHGFADNETRTRRGSALPRHVRVCCTATKVDDEERASGPASSAYRGREVLAPPQPMLGRQHVMTCLGNQADRLLRPLPRRFARIARPARVRIRRRKPWVLARRRLFGWKVRLLTRGLQKESVAAECRPGCHRAPTSSSHYARVHRFPITLRDLCPSEAGGSSHRQLDLVTVRAATPSGQTGAARGTLSTGWGQQLEPHGSP